MFINAVFWIIRTGAPWRDPPPDYGGWSNTHRRFIRWRDKGVWEKLLEVLIDEPDDEWLMIDASHCKVHPQCGGCQGRQPGHGPHPRGLNTQIHLAVDAFGLPVRVLITPGTTADCTQAGRLIEGLSAEYLLADRGYASNALLEQAKNQDMETIIPPKKNRIMQDFMIEDLYKLRHLVENAFLPLKKWRGIAIRYAKNTASLLAVVLIQCIALWARIS